VLASRSHLRRNSLCAAANVADGLTVLTRRLVCAAARPWLQPLGLLHSVSCCVVVCNLGSTLAVQFPAVKCGNINLRSGICSKQLVANGAVTTSESSHVRYQQCHSAGRFDSINCVHHTMIIIAAACHTPGVQQLRAVWAWPLLLQVCQRCCCHLPLGGRVISLPWLHACACNAPANSVSGRFSSGLGTCTAGGRHIYAWQADGM
jgi:hypothetical protein